QAELAADSELFLLADPRTLVLFRLAGILDPIAWMNPTLVSVRLVDHRRDSYRERVVTGPDGSFERFERIYPGSDPRMARIGLTSDAELAMIWQSAPDPRTGWMRLRQLVKKDARYAATLPGRVFNTTRREEVAAFTRELVRQWRRPDATVESIRSVGEGIWAHESAEVLPDKAVKGPLWIGAGRELEQGASAIGPAVMWDHPDKRPVGHQEVNWLELEPLSSPAEQPGSSSRAASSGLPKRVFDVVFSLLVLAATLPLYPIIALAIIIEDGRPVFFKHRRETVGGKEFPCIKFRSMRNDAEHTKAQLASQNQADGPQFFMEEDPRLTRIGSFLRSFQLDELPQFINVLRGEMSVVGPRPSPFRENQYCPPWREARLSVRPGVTGLWQISRTRAEGADFQEWIKYDIQYVERQSFWLDMWIIWQTVLMLVRRVTRP
ncbi:MAG: sugar transferase, partial [Phycisphaerales bacterium]|nr:sugar transferase [Phycisphaerales bacterium]